MISYNDIEDKNEGDEDVLDKSYEGVILELLTRIQSLEERVQHLERQSTKEPLISNEKIAPADDDKLNKITRSVARSHVMNRLTTENKDIVAIKGNKATGASIIIQSKKNPGKEIKAKFYYSKSHLNHVSSWHTVSTADIQDDQIELHIFTVSYNQDFHSYFFTTDELRDFVKGKRSDNAGLYHFYFHQVNGENVENRDQKYDVSKYYDRWALVSEMF